MTPVAEPLWPDGRVPITAYRPTGAGPWPAMVVLPGGGYTALAGHEGAPVAEWLAALGIAAFMVEYRVAPHRHPVPLADAARAVRWVRHHADRWPIDPHRVGLLGSSAGGHLAGLVATERGPVPGAGDVVDAVSYRPDLLVLCYPVVRLAGPAAHAGSAAALLGPDAPDERREALSIDRRVDAATPPVFVWHTATDAAVPVANTLALIGALAAHQVTVEAHIYPRGRHGLGLATADPHVANWTRSCAAFFAAQGF